MNTYKIIISFYLRPPRELPPERLPPRELMPPPLDDDELERELTREEDDEEPERSVTREELLLLLERDEDEERSVTREELFPERDVVVLVVVFLLPEELLSVIRRVVFPFVTRSLRSELPSEARLTDVVRPFSLLYLSLETCAELRSTIRLRP